MASPFLMLVRHRPGRNAAQFFAIVVVGHGRRVRRCW
jgi:hypothetical protein